MFDGTFIASPALRLKSAIKILKRLWVEVGYWPSFIPIDDLVRFLTPMIIMVIAIASIFGFQMLKMVQKYFPEVTFVCLVQYSRQ